MKNAVEQQICIKSKQEKGIRLNEKSSTFFLFE